MLFTCSGREPSSLRASNNILPLPPQSQALGGSSSKCSRKESNLWNVQLGIKHISLRGFITKVICSAKTTNKITLPNLLASYSS